MCLFATVFTLDELIAVKCGLFNRVTISHAFVRGEFPYPGARNFVAKKLESFWHPTVKISLS